MMESLSILEKARLFLYRNGRLIDRKRYEYWFEDGTKEPVIAALRAYQNVDGGFGHALEPDIRCPYSQPVPTEMALAVMDEINGWDEQVLDGIIRYLRTVTLQGGGIPLVFASASEYPHAPWWKAKQDDRPSINPTGSIIGWLYKQRVRTEVWKESWFQNNVAYIWRVLEQEKPEGFHYGTHWITFLQHTPERDRAAHVWPKVDEWLRSPGTIETDADAEGYVHKVLDWAPFRESYAGKFVSDELLNEHLEALVRGQREDGGWTINWPVVSPGVETEWRGWLTLERLKTLKSYGVIA